MEEIKKKKGGKEKAKMKVTHIMEEYSKVK